MAAPLLKTAPEITPENLGLWPPQLEAVRRMHAYIQAYQSGAVDQAALVHMPTGSGKTGVIAALARCIPEVGCTLILSPRVGLREQLTRQVSAGFFKNLTPPVDPNALPKQVIEVSELEDLQALQDLNSTVLITTIHLLSYLPKAHTAEWQTLLDHVTLVIVDEGHCEPAPFWSVAIRSFSVPKIIFTATPFRNDLKIFDIDPAHIFSYTYHQALQDHLLREAEFISMPETDDPNEFIDGVLNFYDTHLGKLKGPRPRLMIRCDGREQIRQIGKALEARNRDYLAIHETFSDKGKNPHECRHVPDPKKRKEDIWVHQYKLQEGIDDPRFQVLAIFNRVQNGRDLVQQVGRIIRNPGSDPLAKGYILDHSGGQHQDLWLSFLKYDQALTASGTEAFNLPTGSAWLAGLFESQPILTYMHYRFRTPLDFQQVDPYEDLLLPRMVNLRQKEEGFRMERLCKLVEKAFRQDDHPYYRYDESQAVIYLYVTFENSPLLTNEFFLEPRLELIYLCEVGDYLAYYDSSGSLPVGLDAAHLGKAANADDLKKLFSDHDLTRLTQVSLRNANLGTIAIRSHTLSAGDIRKTVSAFDDHAQVCANVTGYSREGGEWLRRYLGFDRGRISEASGRCSLGEYESWLSNVVGTLNGSRDLHATFRRYAQVANREIDPAPRHILLDLSEVQDFFETVGGGKVRAGEVMDIEDVSCEVKDGQFKLKANNEVSIPVAVSYDDTTHRYQLDSPVLDGFFRPIAAATDHRGLISYLNQEQSFRVIPKTDNVIYTLGEFYEPPFKVGNYFNRRQFEVSKVLKAVPLLGQIKAEKGILADPAGWDADTLFGIIAQLGEPAGLEEDFGNPDILVCDDMGTEAADFILADTNSRRVVFIHAKAASTRHPVSASALQEVIGQATKNINFLGMFSEQVPKNLGRWDQEWSNKDALCTTPRLRRGFGPGKKTWEKIRSIIRHPLADREVWLFLGQMLSKKRFEDELGLDPVGAEAFQAACLLFATLTNVASVGAKLRVFCYP